MSGIGCIRGLGMVKTFGMDFIFLKTFGGDVDRLRVGEGMKIMSYGARFI